MQIPNIQVTSKEYLPGNYLYDYMYAIAAQQIEYGELEIKVLQSNGYNTSYPGTYCQNTVFGGEEKSIDNIISWQGSAANPFDMPTAKEYADTQMNLAEPVKIMYSHVTKFASETEFGQEPGETVPAKVVIDNSGASSVIKWYKNGNLVTSETLGNKTNTFALAVVTSGNTISSYAYIYQAYYVRDRIFTSGVKSNANVLAILNAGGVAGEDNQTGYGFEDEELGEFALSLIFSDTGTDAYTGNATSTFTGSGRTADAYNDLVSKCEQYNGYLGSDLIEYMSEGQGWNYLKTKADANTPVSVQIPTAVEGEYVTIKCENIGGAGPYFSYYDTNDVRQGYVATSVWERGKGKAYLTWYPQSSPYNASSRIIMCYYNDNNTNGWYAFSNFNIAGLGAEINEYNNSDLFYRTIEGYDPDAGQEDEEQEDPDDVQDPDYDALASGFLYAFMVDAGDMVNLADSLVPDTLAQKIRADFGNNLFEFIVSYHIMPCLTNADSLNKVAIAYRGEPFLYGENNTQLTLAPISKSFYTVSCGTKICLPTGTRQNGFENWSLANVQLYLPFIGYVHLNTADVWGKAITISYKFDILQGTCVANIGVGKNGTLYSYEGVCKYSIPFTTAIDHSNMALLSGIMSTAGAAVSLGGAIAGGSPSGLLNVAGGISSAAGSFLQAAEHKSLINRGGCLSGAPGWQMPRHPALIITVPNWISPGMVYNDINGYPTYKTGILSGWTGNYVEVSQIDLRASSNSNGASPNDSELDMINSILKGGVYV